MAIKASVHLYKFCFNLYLTYGLSRFALFRSIGRFIKSYIKTNYAEVDGFKMILDKNDSLSLSINNTWEPFTSKIIKEYIKKGDTVLDIGANIGYFTLIFSKLVGPSGNIYAFEPEPTNFSLLKNNLIINNITNVTLEQKAVSDQTKKTKLFLNKYNMGAHSLQDFSMQKSFVEVESIKLDDYTKIENSKVDFIKLDIEGAECNAIQGMNALLNKNENLTILTEFSPSLLKGFGRDPIGFLNILTNYGFKIYHIDELNKQVKPFISYQLIADLEYQELHDNLIGVNLICIKQF